MKPVLFAAGLLAFATAATTAQARTLAPAAPTDTIVVRLPNKAIMTLVVRDAKQLRELPKYHLDSLVARLDTYIQRADEAAKTAKTDRVTLEFFPNQDAPGQGLPEEVRITTRKNRSSGERTNRVDVALSKVFGLQAKIDANGTKMYSTGNNETRRARRDSLNEANRERQSTRTDLILDLGLNALANRGSGAPELRTLGSRYVNIGLNTFVRLGGKKSPAYVVFGPEFAFNNYMLEGNNKWVNLNGQTSVVPETNGRQYQKTKLATSTFTVPLMVQFKFREKDASTGHSRRGFTIGAGGFVGYRLGSWTKLKYYEEGNTYKDKDYGPYNLTDWQYGLQGVIGYRTLQFFAKYNLNELFREGQGPQAQTVSFGLRLLK
ncbi:MAG TPA: outer membrane beta-barrel protein [Hymenobacter sp.]|uniref:outer membrane beta-barrel protein n=1 Tax=Hymenobacter sp. TaxID=1898978 RepID=UPI002D8042BF|nr:outer membrane beta-barrel protein [Hymenobacter sp.]HET9505286.1 outer membrane beta-barrel protein [Hymenobacter sp.]